MKRIFICALIVSILSGFIFVMFLFNNSSMKIKIAFFSSIFILIISWLLCLFGYLSERKRLKEYTINGYCFAPLDNDLYLDLRMLLETKESDNSIAEKELLDEYKEKTLGMVKKGIYYLVYLENKPYALVKYVRDFKYKEFQIEVVYTEGNNLENELNFILEKENIDKKWRRYSD